MDAGPAFALSQALLRIDLAALAANWRLLRARAAPAECGAVVKADAYGCGIEPVTRALAQAGCRTFFVAQASEGARVRAVVGDDPAFRIYALNGLTPDPDVAAAFADLGLRPVIGSPEEARLWGASRRWRNMPLPAALQIDTGMNRLGVTAAEAAALAGAREAASMFDLAMSHFLASEDAGDARNGAQIAAFEAARAPWLALPASMANSSGVFLPQRPFYDLVRPGYALYGGNPTPGAANPMRAVVRLEARILRVRAVPVGASVGYNGVWRAARASRIGIVGVGYADGFLRSATARPDQPAIAVVGGAPCPLVGRVSMDLSAIDLTDAPADIAAGDPAVLLGDGVGVDDLAARAGTIGYEILTGLGRRYHRRYEN